MDIQAHDPLLRTLALKERAEEDIYFEKRDRDLMRHLHEQSEAEQRRTIRELSHDRCPACGAHLARVERHGVAVEECPVGHGMWLTDAERRTLAQRERASRIRRYIYWPKPKR